MTPAQREVYQRRQCGYSYRYIAQEMAITEKAAQDLFYAAKRYMQPTGALKGWRQEYFQWRVIANLRGITRAIRFLQVKK